MNDVIFEHARKPMQQEPAIPMSGIRLVLRILVLSLFIIFPIFRDIRPPDSKHLDLAQSIYFAVVN
jgi:hypothetical protein